MREALAHSQLTSHSSSERHPQTQPLPSQEELSWSPHLCCFLHSSPGSVPSKVPCLGFPTSSDLLGCPMWGPGCPLWVPEQGTPLLSGGLTSLRRQGMFQTAQDRTPILCQALELIALVSGVVSRLCQCRVPSIKKTLDCVGSLPHFLGDTGHPTPVPMSLRGVCRVLVIRLRRANTFGLLSKYEI